MRMREQTMALGGKREEAPKMHTQTTTITPKDQLLTKAYSAYTKGDVYEAISLYLQAIDKNATLKEVMAHIDSSINPDPEAEDDAVAETVTQDDKQESIPLGGGNDSDDDEEEETIQIKNERVLKSFRQSLEYMQEATGAYKEGNISEVINLYSQAIRLGATAKEVMAQIKAVTQDDKQKSNPDSSTIATATPEIPKKLGDFYLGLSHMVIARDHLEAEKMDAALSSYKQALQNGIKPELILSKLSKLLSHYAHNDDSPKVRECTQLILECRVNKKSISEFMQQKAESYVRDGRHSLAVEFYKLALEAGAKTEELVTTLGMSVSGKNFPEALQAYKAIFQAGAKAEDLLPQIVDMQKKAEGSRAGTPVLPAIREFRRALELSVGFEKVNGLAQEPSTALKETSSPTTTGATDSKRSASAPSKGATPETPGKPSDKWKQSMFLTGSKPQQAASSSSPVPAPAAGK